MHVSVIVNCHHEGLLLERSLASAIRAIDVSGIAGECELIVVADQPTKTTSIVLASCAHRVDRVVHTGSHDLGLARNAGVEASRGRLMLFLDGDDLWGGNWVRAAWARYLSMPAETILHPQHCVFFGARSEVLIHPDWRDQDFDPRTLAARNCWTALCGVGRELAIELPFPRTDRQNRFGYEDWSWYTETVARGARHVVVRDTVHFVRLKHAGSLRESLRGFLRVPSLAFAEYLAADDSTRPHDL